MRKTVFIDRKSKINQERPANKLHKLIRWCSTNDAFMVLRTKCAV